jgi:hypothetical protein
MAKISTVDLGWGRKPLREQLAGSTLDPDDIEHADKDADAVMRLHIRGLITDKMRDHTVYLSSLRIRFLIA